MPRPRFASLLAALLLASAGCEGTAGVSGAVLLSVRWGDDVPAADRQATVRLELSADGDARSYGWSITDLSALTPGPLTQRYRPATKSGALLFHVSARDGDGAVRALALNGIMIDPSREVTLELVLHRPDSMPDGGVPDLVMPDLRVADGGTDLRMPDLGMPDLVTPDLTMPDLRMPDLQTPDLQMPDLQMPDLQMPDLQMPDLEMPDLQMPDLQMPDLQMPDLQMPDLQMPDLVPPPDLAPPPDMTPALIPSHTASRFNFAAGALTAAVATIDTTQRVLLDSNKAQIPLPAGATFTSDGKSAVLSVGAWTIAAGNNVAVVGAAPLIVLASGQVTIGARVAASAVKDVAGPGGAPTAMGPGAGVLNQTQVADDPGGGGAGFATVGAAGGTTKTAMGGAGGPLYGPLVADWNGGSGGGQGSAYTICQNLWPGAAFGGGGGGAIQISSAVGITVQASGSVEANGGGGRGGCSGYVNNVPEATGGGGGGSGGTVFLEAPAITVSGPLYANGGGGGGGGDVSKPNNGGGNGTDGQDGQRSANAAAGGTSSGMGTNGGTGGTVNVPTTGVNANAADTGGGGGSAGRIWLRTRGAPATVGVVCSPTPVKDTNY